MNIKSLKLKNFRNYEKLDLTFEKGLNVFVGKNAQGKTNILEAIYFSALGKSFRLCKDKEIIQWNKESGKTEINFKNRFRNKKIEVFFQKNQKKSIKIDKISIKKIVSLLGELTIVFFSPDELKLIKDSPEERRRFMNINISQTDKKYFYNLSRYEKILQNRNKLLKTTKEFGSLSDTIDIWDKALCEVAEKISVARKSFVDGILPYAKKAHEYISNGSENFDMKYKSMPEINSSYKENMLKQLQKNLEKDYRLGFTSIGPHRDDIDLFINGVEVKNYGSQGQQRTVALALKLAELESLKERTGEYPILLLDDVFSELDENRREKLLKFTSRTQTFITCTEFNYKMKDVEIFQVVDGKIKK